MSILKSTAVLNFSFKLTLLGLALLSLGMAAYAENHPPVLSPIGVKDISPGGTLSFSLSAADPDGDKVKFADSGLPPGAALDPDTGSFSWSPSMSQLGTYNIVFTATDNGSPPLAASVTAQVRVVFRTTRQDKAWGFGGKGEVTMLETTNPEDLYPKLSRIEVDGNPTSSQDKINASEGANIKFVLSSPYDIDRGAITAVLDGKPIGIPSYSDVQTFGTQNNVLSLSFYVSPKGLGAGDHSLVIKAGNSLGFSVQSVTISIGALRIMDIPLAFPNPYNPNSGSPVILQYSLSQNAAVDIIIFSFNGQVIKKISVESGVEGGKAGLNKLSWDGRTDFGTYAANGIYLGTIMERQEHKVLGKLKLTIYR